MCITYQNAQKNMLCLFVSESCMLIQLWTLFILGELIGTLNANQGSSDCYPKASEPLLTCSSCRRVYFMHSNMSYHHTWLRIDAFVLNVLFPFRCVSTLPGRIRSWCEQCVWYQDLQHRRTNTCSAMKKSRRRTLDIYFIWLSATRQAAPPLNLWFQSTFKLTILWHTVQLSFIGR
jgi:hypothetical protein